MVNAIGVAAVLVAVRVATWRGIWRSEDAGCSYARKLHIGVQRDGLIVAAKLTDSDVRDHEPIPDLLEQINGPIDRITADEPMVPTTRSPCTLRHETEARAR
jgi:hypothetical protein